MKLTCILSTGLLGILVFTSESSARVRVAGSDLLGEVLRSDLEAEAKRRDWELELDFSGSLNAKTALEDGSAEVAILAVPDDVPPQEGFVSFPFVFEVTVVGVNELNPVRELSLAQLREIFASRAKGESSTWAEVASNDAWGGRLITFHATRDRNHLNLELFRALALGPREMRTDINYLSSRAAVIDQVAGDSNAIGLWPASEDHPQVRLLFISAGEDSQAYGPTPQSVFYGDYPLRLSYYIVYAESASKEALEVVRFLLGPGVAETVSEADYVPAPEIERGQFQMDLDFGG